MSVDTAVRNAVLAVHRRAQKATNQEQRHLELGTIVRMTPEVSVELFESAHSVELGDALAFTDQLRWWDAHYGLRVGDVLALVEMHDSTWLGLAVITERDDASAGIRPRKPPADRGKGEPLTDLAASSDTGLITATSTAVPSGGGTPTITVTFNHHIVKKMEVYDATGTRVGWVPVFQDLP